MAKKAQTHIRTKVGTHATRAKRLETGQSYISGAAAADPQKKLDPEVQTVTATRTSLMALLGQRSDLKAKIDTIEGQIVVGDYKYDQALLGYARAAADLSGANASLLAALGVSQAAKPPKDAGEHVGTPTLSIMEGVLHGEVEMKCVKVPYAGAYIFQYKLEPSQPSDPWLGDLMTSRPSITLSDLAFGQPIRVRARAVGITPGPWSAEVLGNAR